MAGNRLELKVIVVGDSATGWRPFFFNISGKTSVIRRYAQGTFDKDCKSTIGSMIALIVSVADHEVDFLAKAIPREVVWGDKVMYSTVVLKVLFSDADVILQLWDMAGQER